MGCSQRNLVLFSSFTARLVFTALLLVFTALSASAVQKSETAFFRFYFETENGATADLIETADTVTRKVKFLTGFAPGEKIDVFIAEDRNAFKRLLPKKSRVPSWAVGVAFPALNRIILLKEPRIDLAATFRHELNHILLGQAFRGKAKVPRWLDEGLAMIVAEDWNLSAMTVMTGAVLTGAVMPMADIARRFPYEEKRARIAYAQSFYFIAFLKREFGEAGFRRFLDVYRNHQNFKLALKRTYYLDWPEIEELWQQYLRLRFNWIPILTSTGFLWFAASIIFVIGYFLKKRRSRQKLAQWEEEEKVIYDD